MLLLLLSLFLPLDLLFLPLLLLFPLVFLLFDCATALSMTFVTTFFAFPSLTLVFKRANASFFASLASCSGARLMALASPLPHFVLTGFDEPPSDASYLASLMRETGDFYIEEIERE